MRSAAPLVSTASVAVLAFVFVSGGCTVGPDYERPELDPSELPETWGEHDDPALRVGDVEDIRTWWTVFDDPQLTSLIERAAEGNKDLAVAVARVTEARARLGFAKAGRYPSVGVGAGTQVVDDFTTGFETRTQSSIGADVSWEIDVFGRVARRVEAATADFEATEEEQHDVQVTLFAEVARAYLAVRALQAQLEAADRNIDSQQEVLRLTEARRETGISSRLDVTRSIGLLAQSEAAVAPLRVNLAREINTLGVLIGQNPQTLHAELAEPKPIPVPPDSVAVGMPANLLRQRPDIRSAERALAAQTARVGVASADLYPTFSINGNLGLSALDGDNLFDAASRSFALGPSMRWQLFDGGAIRSQISVEDARVEQAILLYEKAVLSALEDVETAMTTFTEQGALVEASERGAAASREALGLALVLYEDGLIDYEQVLDVQRTVLAQEQQVASARGQAATAVVFLYRALGGGWDPDATGAEAEAEGDGDADAADGDARRP